MPVRLVPDIPHDPIVRGIENVVERNGQLRHSEGSAEVAAGLGHGVDDVAAELLAKLAELGKGQVLEVDRVVDGVLLSRIGPRGVGERGKRRGSGKKKAITK